MGQRIHTRLVPDALLTALWWHRPDMRGLLHSDQGFQYAGQE